MEAPRPARGARRTDLEERLAEVRRALGPRDESPSGAWVEETARDLADGTKPGWWLPDGGLAFYARRGTSAFGHLHAGVAPGPVDRVVRLGAALLDGLAPELRSITVGITGLAPDEERAAIAQLRERFGGTEIGRRAMERPLSADDGGPAPPAPAGAEVVAATDVTLEALADLDRRAFAGTLDAVLVGGEPLAYREILDDMLAGRVGRFVGEASIAVIERDPVRLVGAVVATEQSIRRAVLADFVVDPERRRRGLGRFQMRWVLRALRALGYDSVRLWVTDANAPARALYDAFGFKSIAEASIYRWDRPPAAAAQPQSGR